MVSRILAVALLLTALLVAPAANAAAVDEVGLDDRGCGGRIDWACYHWSGQGMCGLYLDLQGTGDGRCIIYE